MNPKLDAVALVPGPNFTRIVHHPFMSHERPFVLAACADGRAAAIVPNLELQSWGLVGFDGPVLIDQGASDQFLDLLKPESLAAMMALRRQPGQVRMQKGYDHSYFFVSSFMEDHVTFHAEALYRD